MIQPKPAANRPLPLYGFMGRLFDDAQCDMVLELGRRLIGRSGSLDEGAKVDAKVRDSQVAFLPIDDSTRWIYEAIWNAAAQANQQAWQFSLAAAESIQFTSYTAPGQHYREHIDVGMSPPFSLRKLSVMVQLSSSADYEGGDFVILSGGGERRQAPRGRGQLILFPSYVMHRVEPVTGGRRHSLVNWLVGEEPFR